MPFDVRAVEADFVVGSTLKWLCGVAGAGVLQVREQLLRECRPELRGWFSQENPFAWALDSFEYARDARRFDHGTPSIFACAACLPALDWHAQQNVAELQAHNRSLVEAVVDGCVGLGLELVSPTKRGRTGRQRDVSITGGQRSGGGRYRAAQTRCVCGLPGNDAARVARQCDNHGWRRSIARCAARDLVTQFRSRAPSSASAACGLRSLAPLMK